MEQFSVNEIVLAKDRGLLYDAKIRKIDDVDGNLQYYVHYIGWHTRHDVWLKPIDVLKLSDSNLQLKLKLLEDCNLKKDSGEAKRVNSLPIVIPRKKRKRETKSLPGKPHDWLKPLSIVCSKVHVLNDIKPVMIPIKEVISDPLEISENIEFENQTDIDGNLHSSNSEDGSTSGYSEMKKEHWSPRVTGIRPLVELCSPDSAFGEPNLLLHSSTVLSSSDIENPLECDKQYEGSQNKDEIIPMSDILKTFLDNDYEILKSKQKILILPANPSVEQLLSEYLAETTRSRPGADISGIKEFVKGTIQYFNVMVEKKALIYSSEIMRHKQVKKQNENLPWSKIYGTVHLLRLISEISPYINKAIDDEKEKQLFASYYLEFLNYIQDNAVKFLSEDIYVNMS